MNKKKCLVTGVAGFIGSHVAIQLIVRGYSVLGVDNINDVSGLKYDPMMPKTIEKYCPSLVLCAYGKKTITGNQILKTKYLRFVYKSSIKNNEYTNFCTHFSS